LAWRAIRLPLQVTRRRPPARRAASLRSMCARRASRLTMPETRRPPQSGPYEQLNPTRSRRKCRRKADLNFPGKRACFPDRYLEDETRARSEAAMDCSNPRPVRNEFRGMKEICDPIEFGWIILSKTLGDLVNLRSSIL
jgi:hypothetical protein